MSIRDTLFTEKTKYQNLALYDDTHEFGRMLVLDGMVITTILDEFAYQK